MLINLVKINDFGKKNTDFGAKKRNFDAILTFLASNVTSTDLRLMMRQPRRAYGLLLLLVQQLQAVAQRQVHACDCVRTRSVLRCDMIST
jgi:hypothetical protein